MSWADFVVFCLDYLLISNVVSSCSLSNVWESEGDSVPNESVGWKSFLTPLQWQGNFLGQRQKLFSRRTAISLGVGRNSVFQKIFNFCEFYKRLARPKCLRYHGNTAFAAVDIRLICTSICTFVLTVRVPILAKVAHVAWGGCFVCHSELCIVLCGLMVRCTVVRCL